MRILKVEDEKKVASFIKKGLEEEGYAVDLAAVTWLIKIFTFGSDGDDSVTISE